MKGADYIAEFLSQRGINQVFLLNGGAAAFMVDAVARHPGIEYACFQHEQGAAIAGDAVWRMSGKVGAVMATSGPGATNLITGICCNWFDSIPCLYLTGQVNLKHAEVFEGSRVRQFGFQETDIVAMVRNVTKYARQVTTAEELREALSEAYNACLSGRMGPALIDIPMDLQQRDVGDDVTYVPDPRSPTSETDIEAAARHVNALFADAERPMVLFGAGLGLSGAAVPTEKWLRSVEVPVVASWSGSCYLNQAFPGYLGGIGVYGNRGANYALQNCDALLVLGSRLDTRQRPGDPRQFAPKARVHVIDVDEEELRKYAKDDYGTTRMHLADFPAVLERLERPRSSNAWRSYCGEMKQRFYGVDISVSARQYGTISPYALIAKLNRMIDPDATIVIDVGALTCWFFQTFERTTQQIFTNGGLAPISYALPASVGATRVREGKQTIVIIGDGGLQSNIQELQTVATYAPDTKLIVLNNLGYGIVKQFQDLYLEGRHEATGNGYGVPDFRHIAKGYGLRHIRIEALDDFDAELLRTPGGAIIEMMLHPNTLIEPKLELGRPINDQYPYVPDDEFHANNRFVAFERPEWVSEKVEISD